MNRRSKPIIAVIVGIAIFLIVIILPLINCQKKILPSLGQLTVIGEVVSCRLKILELKIYDYSGFARSGLTTFDVTILDILRNVHKK